MRKINIHEAKTTLSRLVEAVEAGEEIVLARAGRPVAMITRLPVRHGIRTVSYTHLTLPTKRIV